MKNGQYSTDEIEKIRVVAQDIKANGGSIMEAATKLAKSIGRSPRGVALSIGRELAKGKTSRRNRSQKVRLGKVNGQRVTSVISRLSVLARELDDLGRQRKVLDAKIEAKLTEYNELRSGLLGGITPTSIAVGDLEIPQSETASA